MVVKSQHKKNSIINVEQVCDDCGVEFCDGRHCPLFEYDSHCRTEPEVRFLFEKKMLLTLACTDIGRNS